MDDSEYRPLALANDKKNNFIGIYVECWGIVKAACHIAQISRATYYNWLKEDPTFKAAIDVAKEDIKDAYESLVVQKMREGSETMMIWYGKTRVKDRFGDENGKSLEDEENKRKRRVLILPDNGRGLDNEYVEVDSET